MEFSLLKFWRGVGGAATTGNSRATDTIASPEDPPVAAEMDDAGGGDEGPFFDLELAVADGEEGDDSEESQEERDLSLCLPSSDDLFFNGKLVPLETNSIVVATEESDFKPQLAVSLLKSATRLRIFMLGLRKPKSTVVDSMAAATAAGASMKQRKFFVKFEVEEIPIVSGDNRNSCDSAKSDVEAAGAPAEVPEEKKTNSKEVVQKYLGKIMPLYLKVSKIYAEKLRFSGPLVPSAALAEMETETATAANARATVTEEKRLKPAMPSRLRVVYRRLGKSKSASAAVGSLAPAVIPPQRRDDSLLQQEDGIQSAIAHCKRSFFATASKVPGSESPLMRSKGDPGDSCKDD